MSTKSDSPTVTSLTGAILGGASPSAVPVVVAPSTPNGVSSTPKRKMRKKTSDVPTRIYSYGARPPVLNANLVEDEFRNARKYYNQLVSIERNRRAAIRAEQRRHGQIGPLSDAVDVLVNQLVAAKDAVKAKRAGAGKLANVTTEVAVVKAISAQLKSARQVLRAERDRVKKDPTIAAQMQPQYDQIKAQDHADRLAARKNCKLRHGTYVRVENAVQQAKKPPKKEVKVTKNGKPKRPTPWHLLPKFKRYDGTGYLGTQLLGYGEAGDPNRVLGMTVTEAFSCQDTRLQIDPVPANTFSRRRHHRRLASRTRVRIRIGTNKDKQRSPIWAEFPIILHRPLPDDAIIKWAYIIRKRVGLTYEYRFQLTIESNTFRTPASVGNGVVAVDLGWRNLVPGPDWHSTIAAATALGWHDPIEDARNGLLDPDQLDSTQRAQFNVLEGRANQLTEPYGVRVGYWCDDNGNSTQILVPERTRRGLEKPRDLRAIRDKMFDAIRDNVASWVSSLSGSLPTALAQLFVPKSTAQANTQSALPSNAQIAARIAMWGAPRRMAMLFRVWQQNRFAGDTAMFNAVEAWAQQDRHLYFWEASQQDRRINHRREQYRIFAAQLARTYEVIVLEDPDSFQLTKAVFAEAAEPEDGLPTDGKLQRRTARLAAAGELRDAIIKAAAKYGAKIVFVNPEFTTQRCHMCKLLPQTPWDAKPHILHTCDNCNAVWDQDYNACKNMLDDYLTSLTAPSSSSDPSTGAEPLEEDNVAESDDDVDVNDESSVTDEAA